MEIQPVSNEEDKEDDEVSEDKSENDVHGEKLDIALPPTAKELQQAAIMIGLEEMKKNTRRILPLIHRLQVEVDELAAAADRFALAGESPIESVHVLRGLLEVKKAYHALDLEVTMQT
jgi:hypothetical protein